MNKTKRSFILCFLTTLVLAGSMLPVCASSEEYTKSTKKSRRRLNRNKRIEDSAPVLNTQQAEKVETLNQTCKPQILRFDNELPERDKTLCMFLQQLEFTQTGIATFFAQTFNRREYGTEFLPHNFSHLVQFLEYGQQSKQPHEFFDGVIRLFNTKLKGASFVNCAAFERMNRSIAPILGGLFPQEELSLWKELKRLLWTSFRDHFSFLKRNPMGFFEDISDQIIQKVKVAVTTPDRLRATIVRFLATGIDKLAWSPDDQLQSWYSFNAIGEQLTQLYQLGIVNDSLDLNELYWGLVERYCFFLELAGSALKLETCQTMKNELNNQTLKWLHHEEQEEGLETKQERLMQALIETEAKIRIAKEGILTEILPHRRQY